MARQPRDGRRVPGRGVVFPSPVVVLTVIAVAMAAIAFVATRGGGPAEREVATPVRDDVRTTAPAPPSTPPAPKPKPKPVKRGAVMVEVYNNSGITGLAAEVAGTAGDAGWNVVGADNWYGTIPATSVYFPPGMRKAGKQLALDLGIERTATAEDPMKLDRLTVILTGSLG